MYFVSEKEGNCTQVLQKIVRVCVGKKEGEREEGSEWVRCCDLGRLKASTSMALGTSAVCDGC